MLATVPGVPGLRLGQEQKGPAWKYSSEDSCAPGLKVLTLPSSLLQSELGPGTMEVLLGGSPLLSENLFSEGVGSRGSQEEQED